MARAKKKAANPYTMPDKPKAQGNFGNVVRWIQYQLGIEPNGDFDSNTTKAVKAFQKRHSLPESGIVDRITRDKLAE